MRRSIPVTERNPAAKARFEEADIRIAEFGNGYDLAMMIFGEFNVFSEEESRDHSGEGVRRDPTRRSNPD